MSAGRSVNSGSLDWCTPRKYVDAVRRFFGGAIDLDPCSNVHSVVGARVSWMPPEHDGINETWAGFGRIYVNPPYGFDRQRGTRIGDWLMKCGTANVNAGCQVLALVPVATNTGHWKRHVFGKAMAVCFLDDTRLKFMVDGKEGGKGAPMACAMVYWGDSFSTFDTVFKEFGAVVSLKNLLA